MRMSRATGQMTSRSMPRNWRLLVRVAGQITGRSSLGQTSGKRDRERPVSILARTFECAISFTQSLRSASFGTRRLLKRRQRQSDGERFSLAERDYDLRGTL